MRLRRTLQLLLAVALLVVWQGALLHPLEHVNAAGGYVHLADGHGQKTPGNEKSGADPSCDAVAAVALCIGTAQPLSIAPVSRLELLRDFSSSAARNAPALAYRSQAPPTLL
jgi:hypothetical protein